MLHGGASPDRGALLCRIDGRELRHRGVALEVAATSRGAMHTDGWLPWVRCPPLILWS